MTKEEVEKEAEEGLNRRIGTIGYNCRQNCQKPYTDGFQDGAIFGYNKDNEYVKTIIQDLLDNSDEYARQRAMDFLKEIAE